MKSHLQTIIRFASLALIVGAAGFHTLAQERRHDQLISDELYEIVKLKADLIKREISKSKNEWAGTYFAGDHHPTEFVWSLDQGFLVTSSLHTFSPSGVNYGSVKLDRALLTLRPELTKEHTDAYIMSSEFVPVLWDKQHFLVPPNDLKAFAYAVHSKAESQIVEYFCKSQDLGKSRLGLPKLPFKYTQYLKMSPILTRITGLGKKNKYWPSITIGAGRRDGIIEGMTLYHLSKSGLHLSVRVTEVSERTAQAEVSSIGSNESNEEVQLKVGRGLTSRLPKGFIEPG